MFAAQPSRRNSMPSALTSCCSRTSSGSLQASQPCPIIAASVLRYEKFSMLPSARTSVKHRTPGMSGCGDTLTLLTPLPIFSSALCVRHCNTALPLKHMCRQWDRSAYVS